MKKITALALILPALMLSACDIIESREIHNKVVTDYNFKYDVADASDIKLSQVFDDKKDTYFTFQNTPKTEPAVTLPGNSEPMEVSRSGMYWKVHGVYPALIIWVGSQRASIRNNVPVVIAPAPAQDKTAAQKHEKDSVSNP